jgi:microcystin-dependent protein
MTKTTANYSWQMPDPGGSPNTWGTLLNGTTEAIDQQVFENSQALVPVGFIGMYGGQTTPPTGWFFCAGQQVLQSSYPLLYAAIGGFFNIAGVPAGSFNLPDLRNVFPIGGTGGAPGVKGGLAATTLTAAHLPAHTHTATQPAHTHPDPGHTHSASEAAHEHGAGLMRFFGGSGQPLGIAGGGNSNVNYGNTDPAQPTIIVNGALTGLQAAQPAITVNPTPAPTASVPTIPPFLVINFIIKHD